MNPNDTREDTNLPPGPVTEPAVDPPAPEMAAPQENDAVPLAVVDNSASVEDVPERITSEPETVALADPDKNTDQPTVPQSSSSIPPVDSDSGAPSPAATHGANDTTVTPIIPKAPFSSLPTDATVSADKSSVKPKNTLVIALAILGVLVLLSIIGLVLV